MDNNFRPDKRIVNLVNAISGVESNFGARTKSKLSKQEGSYGVLQYTPARFKEDNAKYLPNKQLDINNPKDQKVLKYFEIADQLKNGWTVERAIAAHNAGVDGSANWQNLKGVNKYGNKYDVPAYVDKVRNYYKKLSNYEIEPIPEKVNVGSVLGNAWKGLKDTASGAIAHPIDTVRNLAGGAISAPETLLRTLAYGVADATGLISDEKYRKILEDEANGKNKTLSGLISGNNKMGNAIELGVNGANKKILGAGLETGLDLLTLGKGKVATQAAKEAIEQASKQGIKQTAKTVTGDILKAGLKTAPIGAGYGVTGSLQNDDNFYLPHIINQAAYGAGGGVAAGGLLKGGERVVTGVANKIPRVEKRIEKLDNDIKSLGEYNTQSVEQANKRASGIKDGLALINKIDTKIADKNAKLGPNSTNKIIPKKFFSKDTTPAEQISIINSAKDEVAKIGRESAIKAKEAGVKIDTTDILKDLNYKIESRFANDTDINPVKQMLEKAGNNPEKLFNLIEEINAKHGKKYEQFSKNGKTSAFITPRVEIEHLVADSLRKKFNTLSDRQGYAKAFDDIREVERAMLTEIKKKNKKLDWDLNNDVLIDTLFAAGFENPLFLLRAATQKFIKGFAGRKSLSEGFNKLKKISKTLNENGNNDIKVPTSDLKITEAQIRQQAQERLNKQKENQNIREELLKPRQYLPSKPSPRILEILNRQTPKKKVILPKKK